MDSTAVMYLGRHTLETTLLLSAPMLITCLVVGVAVTLIQAVTAIRDMTLAIVPKLMAMGIVGLLFGNWMLQVMLRFFAEIFTYMQAMGR